MGMRVYIVWPTYKLPYCTNSSKEVTGYWEHCTYTTRLLVQAHSFRIYSSTRASWGHSACLAAGHTPKA